MPPSPEVKTKEIDAQKPETDGKKTDVAVQSNASVPPQATTTKTRKDVKNIFDFPGVSSATE